MSNLPKVYVNPVDKFVMVNQYESTILDNDIDIDSKLDKIVDSSMKYLFLHRYKIILNNNKIIDSSIIGKYSDYILTIDGDKVFIKDIKYIDEIKK